MSTATDTSSVVAWHDVECGHYRADLSLWRELAAGADGPVLDIGAGTGRVALDLARRGHAVIAVERDARLLDALRERAAGLPVRCVLADARELTLDGPPAKLCVVPMQTLQLLEESRGRERFLRAARAALAPGALMAVAIVEDLPAFDVALDAGPGPVPDRGRFGETLYVSRPTAVRRTRRGCRLKRERVLSGPAGTVRSPDEIELDRVGRRPLEREARALGWTVEPAREISATAEHVASTVVMLRA